MSKANQQQVAALLKALLAKGIEAAEALPLIPKFVQAKIYNLQDDDEANETSLAAAGIPAQIRKKILPRKRKASSNGTKSSKTAVAKKPKAPIAKPLPPSSSTPPPPTSILINRSPVLTLWAAVVATYLYPAVTWTEALSLGGAVAAHLSQAKGTALGIFSKPSTEGQDDDSTKEGRAKASDEDDTYDFDLLGVTIRGRTTSDGLRAFRPGGRNENEYQDPYSTWSLLQKRFDENLGHVYALLDEAAQNADSGNALQTTAYQYYVHIRPEIPPGTRGWGAHGKLVLSRLSSFYQKPSNNDDAAK